jgi:hypothetical protein
LRLLTSRRTDLVYDRVRAINRLRARMLECFPALEAPFDYSKKAPLILVPGNRRPERLDHPHHFLTQSECQEALR